MRRRRKDVVVGLGALLVLATGGLGGGAGCGDDERAAERLELRAPTGAAFVEVTLAPFGLRLLDARRREVLRTAPGADTAKGYGPPAATHDEGGDAVKIIPGWDGYRPAERDWTFGRAARVVARAEATATIELSAGPGHIRLDLEVTDGAEGPAVRITTEASADVAPADAWNKVSLAFALREDEHFFGLGERYATVDHRGLSMYSWAEEGGTGKGEGVPHGEANPFPNGPSMTYFPVPFFLSSAGYAVHLDTTSRTETHLGSEDPAAWRVAANATKLSMHVFLNEDPRRSLDAFTQRTGRPFVPATWVFGPRRRVGHEDLVSGVEEWRMLRMAKVPTTGLDDATHFLPARHELGREDELRRWVETAHANGFKVMAYNNPYVAMTEESARADFEHGKANGLFATDESGAVGEAFFISGSPLTVATIDLTTEAGAGWFQTLLGRTLALGYDGWMHDFGEYVRRDWRFADGRRGDVVHNAFPVLSAKAAHDLLMRERPDRDFLFFVRSGYTGTSQYVPAVWGGDPEATFDTTQGLPAMLRGGLNLGMSGVPLWGSDVSGFKCLTDFPYDKEMYLRWAELGAVSPIMMEQNACANPLGRRTKWRLWDDDETVQVYGAMARLHTRLAPYFEVLAREANATGIPIMRHPFLMHPKEPMVWSVESAFYLGPALYAAPVVERGARVKDTWLPPGAWVDILDASVHEGGRHVAMPAPLGKLPLLLRAGAMVPMLDASIETLAPATEPSVVTPARVKDLLDVEVALGAAQGTDAASFTLVDGTKLEARRTATSHGTGGARAPTHELLVTDLAASTSVVSRPGSDDEVRLSVAGPHARRVRWHIHRLP